MKNILVIGASSGYGKATAELLHSTGKYFIYSSSRSVKEKQNSKFVEIYCDLTNPESIINLFDEIKKRNTIIDAVVYASGIAIGKDTIEEGNAQNWNQVMQVNCMSLLSVIQLSISHLRKSRGTFVYIGSLAAYLNYYGGADYCASKAAATTIMKTLRFELLGAGIKTCLVQPGLGDTSFQLNRYNGDQEKASRHYSGIKQLEPIDVARSIQFVLEQPSHVCIDEIIIKPIEQATHGVLANYESDTPRLF